MDKNLCLPSGACSHRCNSGKDCEGSRRASCMALGLHRLVQVDGYTWPVKACPCNSNQSPECQEYDCKWERDPSLVPVALRIPRVAQAARKSNALDYLMAALVVFFVLGLAAVSVFK